MTTIDRLSTQKLRPADLALLHREGALSQYLIARWQAKKVGWTDIVGHSSSIVTCRRVTIGGVIFGLVFLQLVGVLHRSAGPESPYPFLAFVCAGVALLIALGYCVAWLHHSLKLSEFLTAYNRLLFTLQKSSGYLATLTDGELVAEAELHLIDAAKKFIAASRLSGAEPTRYNKLVTDIRDDAFDSSFVACKSFNLVTDENGTGPKVYFDRARGDFPKPVATSTAS